MSPALPASLRVAGAGAIPCAVVRALPASRPLADQGGLCAARRAGLHVAAPVRERRRLASGAHRTAVRAASCTRSAFAPTGSKQRREASHRE
jgi:hypothetical protein